jgi:hypothetical protein
MDLTEAEWQEVLVAAGSRRGALEAWRNKRDSKGPTNAPFDRVPTAIPPLPEVTEEEDEDDAEG